MNPRTPKNVVLTHDTGLTLHDRDGDIVLLDRDGVTLGHVAPQAVGGIRNWLTDALNRQRAEERRVIHNILNPPFTRGRPRIP